MQWHISASKKRGEIAVAGDNREGANVVSRIQAVRLLVALALFACPTIAAAETPSVGRAPLTFRLDSANPPMRSDAPFAVTCLLHSSFTDVLNGELDFE